MSRNSARTVARTIINGVSNAARAETLFANEDVIDGIEFLATLDARTSHVCGALDGTVWRGDEMKHARRPPLHPNCRSTLIPVVDLIDPETGEKIEETAERPAQNADGTYSQVPAKTTFRDYFESQPETFQREWLGEKRFELWKAGQLKFEDLAKPATTYRTTTDDLTPPTEKPKKTAASDDKPNKAPATIPSVEEIRKFTDDAEQSFADEIAVAELWNARAQEAEEAGELENAVKFWEKAAVLWAPITRKLNQLALNKFFPIDDPNSANRKTMTAKTPGCVQTPAPRGFSLLGPRKKYGWTEMSEKELGEIKKALDFVGRVMDNIGANANDLDGVYFQNKTEGRGYYDHGGARRGKPRKIVLSHAFGDARRIGSCAAHELGHAFDHCVPGLQKKVVDFYVAVTTEANGKRTKPKWLGSPYSRAEKYRPARPLFKVPGNYTLKSYREYQDRNNDAAREVSTEFVSMWCQELFKNPHAFIKKYPEFFQGILKVLSNGK